MNEELKIKLLSIAVIILLVACIAMLFIGCTSFKVYWDKDIPIECNMALNADKAYFKSVEKSGTVLPTDRCFKVCAKLRCQEEVFGRDDKGKLNPIDRRNSTKLNDYNSCLNELQ